MHVALDLSANWWWESLRKVCMSWFDILSISNRVLLQLERTDQPHSSLAIDFPYWWQPIWRVTHSLYDNIHQKLLRTWSKNFSDVQDGRLVIRSHADIVSFLDHSYCLLILSFTIVSMDCYEERFNAIVSGCCWEYNVLEIVSSLFLQDLIYYFRLICVMN